MNRRVLGSLAVIIVLLVLVVVSVAVTLFISEQESLTGQGDMSDGTNTTDSEEVLSRDRAAEEIKRFGSEDGFREYLTKSIELMEFQAFSAEALDASASDSSAPGNGPYPVPAEIGLIPVGDSNGSGLLKKIPERYSETNIQVQGIDEPDVVKTDGVSIFSSSERSDVDHGTKIVQAFPVEDLSLLKKVEESGKLLLKDGFLVILGEGTVSGYDVTEVESPEIKWEMEIGDSFRLDDARLYNDEIYLVMANRLTHDMPCVLEPLVINDEPVEISCVDIYHSKRVVPVDTVYTFMVLDLFNGEMKRDLSVVGSSDNTIVYMSSNSLYLSYFEPIDLADFFITFLVEDLDDMLPDSIIEDLKKLAGYDISSEAKMLEMEIIFDDFFESMTFDEEELLVELDRRVPKFYERKKYELESTGIVKIDLQELEIMAFGDVPGRLLNQFAMDEYGGDLRIATTVGEDMFWLSGGLESSNEVYVLDRYLREKGAVRDLGLGERVYSVRFLQDKGYIVTFREIDPFYIIDLSDPSEPKMKGELKIPGYSSYLHPIAEGHILGIGREGQNVKLSLFNIEDPYEPREVDKYILEGDYRSEVLSNHHAFMLDPEYKIFFLPGRNGAYIFSFEGDELELIKTVEKPGVRRAIYIDDYLYLISEDRVTVFDQITYDEVKEIEI